MYEQYTPDEEKNPGIEPEEDPKVADFSSFEAINEKEQAVDDQLIMGSAHSEIFNQPAVLVKTQKVLEIQPDGTNDSFALYASDECQLQLPSVDFREFGCPDKITVTVRPGDRLN